MFKWLRKIIPKLPKIPFIPIFPREGDIFRDMDKERKKRGEVWHYTCINGHKWESYSSPTSGMMADKYSLKETMCPKCGSTISLGNIYRNGKKTQMGAMHCEFGKLK